MSTVAMARKRVERVSIPQAARELTDGDAILVDVREPWERAVFGVIPRGIHIPRGAIEPVADPASPLRRADISPLARIILYCDSGDRSLHAAEAMRRMGYLHVARLDGGLMAWQRAGHPVEYLA